MGWKDRVQSVLTSSEGPAKAAQSAVSVGKMALDNGQGHAASAALATATYMGHVVADYVESHAYPDPDVEYAEFTTDKPNKRPRW